MAALLALEDDIGRAIVVAKGDVKLHPLASLAKRVLLADEPDHDWGAVRCQSPGVRVRVSPDAVPRAIKILDAFWKGMEARGFLDRRSNIPRIEGVEFHLSLEEVQRRVRHVPTAQEKAARKARGRASWEELLNHWPSEPDWDFKPSGEISLKYGSRVIAKDGPNARIEDRLRDAPRVLINLAFQRKAQDAAHERRERYLAKMAERRRLTSRLRQIEGEAAQRLEAHAKRWEAAERIRAFLTAVECAVLDPADAPRRAQWLAWAAEHVIGLDPLGDLKGLFSADLDELEALRAALAECPPSE